MTMTTNFLIIKKSMYSYVMYIIKEKCLIFHNQVLNGSQRKIFSYILNLNKITLIFPYIHDLFKHNK